MRWDLANEEDVKKATERIKYSFKKFTKNDQGAEDCAQEILIGYFEGKGKHQTTDQAVIDYLRRTSGRKGLPGYLEKQALNNADSIESESFRNLEQRSSGLNLEDRLDIGRIIGMSQHWERAVMSLYFVEGYGQTEIGNLFGVSESRICQWLQRIQSRISTRIKAEESTLERKRAKEMEGILPEETKRNWWELGQGSIEGMENIESWDVAVINEASF